MAERMKTELDTRQLRVFLVVADTSHFGRAARELGIAQPNVSQQIARLEAQVGYPLFTRHARGVTLTAAGVFLRQRGELMLKMLESTLETTRSLGSGEAGTLVVGFCGSVMLTPVADAIGAFRNTYPEVKLELRELHVNEQLELLKDGMLDACFVRDGGSPSGVVSEVLLEEPYVAVLPTQHPLAKRRRLTPELLRNEPFILFSPEMAREAYQRTIDLCIAHGFRPNVQREAAQWTSLATFIGAGLGVSIAPASVAQVVVPGVSCVPLSSKHFTRAEMAFRQDSGNPAVARLISYVHEHMHGVAQFQS